MHGHVCMRDMKEGRQTDRQRCRETDLMPASVSCVKCSLLVKTHMAALNKVIQSGACDSSNGFPLQPPKGHLSVHIRTN